MKKSFSDIYDVIVERQNSHAQQSYVKKLTTQGLDTILKKVGEEATEVVIAAKGNSSDELVYELTDLWFHLMVLMVHEGVSLDAIEQEFGRRFGVSGIVEKASRSQS